MQDWSRYLRWFGGTLASLLVVAVASVWLANPYGNLAFSPSRHVLMDDNQRFQYPAVIRSGRYDSLVIGTSTSRLLEPAQLERALGGRFANLALNSGTAWEQWRVAKLFAQKVKAPKTLVVGLDLVWCEADADVKRITPRGFPEWMFDSDPWNDLAYMLNARTLEISGRRVGHMLGLVKERWPHNGYEVFVPPEIQYDLPRARRHLYGTETPPPAVAMHDTNATNEAPENYRFPAHAWLDDLLAARRFERVVLVSMPVHVAAQANQARRNRACFAAIAAIAKRHRLYVVDFRIPSPITREDSHYWDPLHYRVPIATRIVEDLARALDTGTDDPKGNWRILRGAP